jgi:hypothetical protein
MPPRDKKSKNKTYKPYMSDVDKALIGDVGLLPLNQRPAYTPGEFLVKNIPSKHRDPERRMQQEKNLKNFVDLIVPNTPGSAAMTALTLGGGKALVKGGKLALKRLAANVPTPHSYALDQKLEALKESFKNPRQLYQAVVQDIPTQPEMWDTNMLTRLYSLRRGMGLNPLPKGIQKGTMPAYGTPYTQQMGIKGPLRSGRELVVDDYNMMFKFINNVMGYQMKDPKTGKLLNYASFKKLPPDLKRVLFEAPWGKSSARFKPFGLFEAFKTSKSLSKEGRIKGAYQTKYTYKDVFDLNSPTIGETLKKAKSSRKLIDPTVPPAQAVIRSSSKSKGGGTQILVNTKTGKMMPMPKNYKITSKQPLKGGGYLANISKIANPQAVSLEKNASKLSKITNPRLSIKDLFKMSDSGYGADLRSDLVRRGFEKLVMKNPVTWQGEMRILSLPSSTKIAQDIHRSGSAWKIKRVINPNKTPLHEMNKISSSARASDNMILTGPGADGKFRLMELGTGSEKQLEWGKNVKRAVDELYKSHPNYEGVIQFGKK